MIKNLGISEVYYTVILLNDNENSFDKVLICLMVYLICTYEEALSLVNYVQEFEACGIAVSTDRERIVMLYSLLSEEGLKVILDKNEIREE